jgi:hypothetical protein
MALGFDRRGLPLRRRRTNSLGAGRGGTAAAAAATAVPAYTVLIAWVRSLFSCMAFCSNASRLHCADEVSQGSVLGQHPRREAGQPPQVATAAVVDPPRRRR